MRIVFDTSVFIAGSVKTHPKHEIAQRWLSRCQSGEIELIVSAHSLMEMYSVLTKAPFVPKISPATALQIIDQNVRRIGKVVSLSEDDYVEILSEMTDRKLIGGVIYDASIVACARISSSQAILTANEKDFQRLIPEGPIQLIGL